MQCHAMLHDTVRLKKDVDGLVQDRRNSNTLAFRALNHRCDKLVLGRSVK